MGNNNNYYAIFPVGMETGSKIIDKFYRQMCLLNLLQGKHAFIPDVTYERVDIAELQSSKYQIVPQYLTEEDFKLLQLYEKDELDTIQEDFNQLLAEKEIAVTGEVTGTCLYNFNISKLVKSDRLRSESFQSETLEKSTISDMTGLALPLPCFQKQGLYRYAEISSQLGDNIYWLKQLVSFFDFLMKNMIWIDPGLKPEDFLYDRDGNVNCFLAYNYLSLKVNKKDIKENNLYTLANLLNKFYIQDMTKNKGRLSRREDFEKIEGRLIKPLIYDQSSVLYNNFSDIKLELEGKLHYKFSEIRIGLFLDVANIFTSLGKGSNQIRINFDKLLTKIYGNMGKRRVRKKIAVMFLPDYQVQGKNDYFLEHMLDLRDYLESYNFNVVEVENADTSAKQIINGREFDIDDQQLIKILQEAKTELDSIILLTGDRHFYKIARDYQKAGKEVKIISVSKLSTYSGFVDKFEHNYLHNYGNCLEWG